MVSHYYTQPNFNEKTHKYKDNIELNISKLDENK